ncbi:RNA pseudouridylate synthase [Pseudoloma neurophilia]|uniref:RNA pseudouridylate synthase n=1 Tax=Pseudoloma neurophilia TaxID=146866 RepID=A0A0R0LZ92_9MICR|nr:RNA pseudouridylate synthase [Pseudoloma neurophilia]
MVCYFHKFDVQVKGKWFNRQLIEVMSNNFVMKTLSYYKEAIDLGVITVNHKIVDPTYILRNGDSIQHTVHYHEPESIKIPILAIENDFIVVNKPSGIACHPTGGYNLFSVTRILEKHGNLSCINRLDVVTSGILILAFKNAEKYHSQMIKGKIVKKYLAKVKGNFPSEITVNHKLEKNKHNTSFVSENGKECVTIFKLLKYQKGYSLIECQPITGRSHQIRVHLLSIGFPITNDPVYNENPECFYKADKIEQKDEKAWPCLQPIEEKDQIEAFILRNCRQSETRAFKNINAFICLHAYQYKFENKIYTADPPDWAKEFDLESFLEF